MKHAIACLPHLPERDLAIRFPALDHDHLGFKTLKTEFTAAVLGPIPATLTLTALEFVDAHSPHVYTTGSAPHLSPAGLRIREGGAKKVSATLDELMVSCVSINGIVKIPIVTELLTQFQLTGSRVPTTWHDRLLVELLGGQVSIDGNPLRDPHILAC